MNQTLRQRTNHADIRAGDRMRALLRATVAALVAAVVLASGGTASAGPPAPGRRAESHGPTPRQDKRHSTRSRRQSNRQKSRRSRGHRQRTPHQPVTSSSRSSLSPKEPSAEPSADPTPEPEPTPVPKDGAPPMDKGVKW